MKKVLLPLAAFAALTASAAHATPIRLDGSEMDLQQIVDNLAGGSSTIDVVNDQHVLDEAWTTNTGFGAMGYIVMELAGFKDSNSLGIYDIYDPSNRLQLFGGGAGESSVTQFAINDDGGVSRFGTNIGDFSSNVFGFYLSTPAGLWFSQMGLNSDGADHLVAYSNGVGSNSFLLGWEDLSARNWDQDYNDFVWSVSGVEGVSVPEPASLGLLGLGLAGIGAFRRRRNKA